MSIQSHVVATSFGVIEYADVGSGPAILYAHGAGVGFDQGIAIADQFVAHGFRVIAISRFGYLRTPIPEYASVALQADVYTGLLEILGIPSAAIIGVSAGAPSALEFAMRHPQRCAALVLVVPAAYESPELAPCARGPSQRFFLDYVLKITLLYRAFCKVWPSVVIRDVLATPPELVASASASERERVAGILRDVTPLGQTRAGVELDMELTIEPRTQDLKSISAPTLVIAAQDDLYRSYENAKAIADAIRHALVVAYPTGGHLLVGHNEEAFAVTIAFLKGQALDRPS